VENTCLNETKRTHLITSMFLLWMKMSNLFISYIMSISLRACLNHANLASILGSSWGAFGLPKRNRGYRLRSDAMLKPMLNV
jgi:hypothetical protein